MPAGRPTEYTPELLEKAKTYLATCVDEEYRRVKSDGAQSTSYDNEIKVRLPSAAGLAIYLGISRDTIYEWEKLYPEFSDITEAVRAEQEKRILENGLGGQYNPVISRLILSKHGYAERQEVTGKDGAPLILPAEIINKNGLNA